MMKVKSAFESCWLSSEMGLAMVFFLFFFCFLIIGG